MNKIRIISRNTDLVQKITRLLENSYIVTSKKIPENFSYFQLNNPSLSEEDVSGIGLIIIDLTDFIFTETTGNKNLRSNYDFSENNLGEQSYDYKILKELKRIQIPCLLIINIDQAGILSRGIIKFEDVILLKHLEEELLLRTGLVFSKHGKTDSKNLIIIEDIIINLEKYELSIKDNVIELTFKEFEMLKFLIQNEDKVFSRNILLSTIWGYDFYGGNRTVDVHMRRIRSKLPSPYDQMFKTVRNVGYMFSRKI
ncbi:winged helix-turn-helix domain-containing protein [bacterium]|nr:winged helix-turn-helix domain-containing protein [bacterium]